MGVLVMQSERKVSCSKEELHALRASYSML